jgi:hypothetical protein
MGTSNLYALIRIYEASTWGPSVFKITPSTMTVTYNNLANAASLTGSFGSQANNIVIPGRIQVCETLGYFFFAYAKSSSATSLMIVGGTTATIAFSRAGTFTSPTTVAATAAPIHIFNLHY